jgi:hypothetical protein
MKRALPLLAIAAALAAIALITRSADPPPSMPRDGGSEWLNQSSNGSTIPSDDVAHPRGPSTVIRRIMKQAAERQARERREQALAVERALRGEPADAGP